jgi:hypothetical protein
VRHFVRQQNTAFSSWQSAQHPCGNHYSSARQCESVGPAVTDNDQVAAQMAASLVGGPQVAPETDQAHSHSNGQDNDRDPSCRCD